MSADDRPKDLDAEKAVLGALLVSPAQWADVATRLNAADFFRAAHHDIYVAIAALLSRGVAPDLVTLADELGVKLADAGGRAYLAGLVDGVPKSSNAGHYATIVREKARLRRLAALGEEITGRALGGAASSAELAVEAVAALDRALGHTAGGLVTMREAVADYLGHVSSGDAPAITSGYADLDRLIGGFNAGDLIVVAGRPSTGKSSWALGSALAASEVGATLFFSREMSQRRLASRLLAWRSGVQTAKIEQGHATEEEFGRVAAAADHDLPLYIESMAETVQEMAAWCRKLKQQLPLVMVVVDYLQLLLPERRRDSMENEIAGISAGLKNMAKELKVAVVALSQLSRAPEARKDKRPTMADLRGSGAIEQDCDVCVLLFREEMHKPTDENHGVAEAIVAKNRDGPVGVVRLQFEKSLAQFRDMAEGRY